MASISPAEIEYEKAHWSQSVQAAGIVPVSIFYGIAVLTVIARLVARRHQKQSYALDDYLIVFSTLCVTGEYASTIGMIQNGIGKHLLTVQPQDMVRLLKWEVVNLFCYTAAIALVKLSILALMLRIFDVHSRFFKYCVYFMSIWVIAWVIGLYFAYGFQCTPFSRRWSITNSCLVSLELEYSASILNAISDVVVFVLPQPIIWRLQMPLRRKFTISVVFFLGFVATVMGIIKVIYVKGVPGTEHPADYTYTIVSATVFNMLEPLFAVIAACLPSTPAFLSWLQASSFTRLTSHLLSSMRSGKSKSTSKIHSGPSHGSQNSERSWARLNDHSDDPKGRNIYVKTDLSVNASQTDAGQIQLERYGAKNQHLGTMV